MADQVAGVHALGEQCADAPDEPPLVVVPDGRPRRGLEASEVVQGQAQDRAALRRQGGQVVEVDASTGREQFRFDKLGRSEDLECAITPGMPSSVAS